MDIQKDRELLTNAKAKGPLATLTTYVRLSGPGWLQSAITLGGGSLASSLYLGVLVGFSLLWLQPLAMMLGIVMLSAIAYVALSTGQRPFAAINQHVNPVLGWGWLIATMMANLVWSMPQFALGTAAVQQNLFSSVVGTEAMPQPWGKVIVASAILIVCIVVVLLYNSGGRGVQLFRIIIKLMVGIIVVCFFGVVIKMTIAGVLDWSRILRGIVPDFRLLLSPAKTFEPFIAAVDSNYQAFWTNLIVGQQRDVMISAASSAVGINMTFMLPYSMLRRKWTKEFRGLAIFDLATGLFIPFILATGCVVVASASQFHTRPAAGFLGEVDENGIAIQPAKNLVGKYKSIAAARVKCEIGPDAFAGLQNQQKVELIDSLPTADKRLAAMLVKRDAFNLAQSLSPLTGDMFAHYVFGIGVIGMAVSSIILLMLINGFVICEIRGVELEGWSYRLGCLVPCIGVLGPFIWTGGRAQFWLAVPTSMFAMALLPIAYFTFYLLMNQKSLLGDNMPRGTRRAAWNLLMAVAAGLASFGCLWTLWSKFRWIGISLIVAFVALALFVQAIRSARQRL
ncbi:MAG: divalent metal cation transporter [Planctomycetota bacterium]|jgi:Mn2+/Fe2+ NRAMP family transporter